MAWRFNPWADTPGMESISHHSHLLHSVNYGDSTQNWCLGANVSGYDASALDSEEIRQVFEHAKENIWLSNQLIESINILVFGLILLENNEVLCYTAIWERRSFPQASIYFAYAV